MVVPFYIDFYEFGSIVVNGEEYKSDIIIADGKIISDWWRNESHLLLLSDLELFNWQNVKALFIGTGDTGKMKVSSEVLRKLERRNIPFVVARTRVAVQEFNRLAHSSKVGMFHLTC